MKEETFRPDDFQPDPTRLQPPGAALRPSITYWADAWRRLRRNRVAVGALVLLLLLLVMVIVGPHLTPYTPTQVSIKLRNTPPSAQHWFGVDSLGRDLFVRVWIAGRVSLAIGVIGALINMTVGLIYGGVAGYLGGAADNVMMRIVDFIGCVPQMLVIILASLILPPSIGSLIFALTVTGWTGTARIIRGQVLKIKTDDFVSAARALGARSWYIVRVHMFPNVMSQLIVSTTLAIPGLIFAEAFLSFIGLGVVSPNTSWGALCAAAQQNLLFYPYQLFFPTLMISLTMLSFNLFGDGLRDALDPRLRQ